MAIIKIEEKYEYLKDVLLSILLIGIAFVINAGMSIRGLYQDDLFMWSTRRGVGFFKYVFPEQTRKFRPVYWIVAWIYQGILKNNISLIVPINIIIAAIIAIGVYFFAKSMAKSRGLAFTLASMFLISRFSYYNIGQFLGVMEAMALVFALLMLQEGFPAWASIFSSVFVYAGSMQFALVSFMSAGMSFWMIAVMTLFINARMLFYGVSFIDEFKKLGWKAFYLIFALSDETFSLLVGMKQTKSKGSEQVMVYVGLLNHCYWILGTIIGVVIGEFLPFSTKGIDFSMTALFVVILVNQLKKADRYFPFIIGGISAIFWLILVGKQYFLVCALATTMIGLIAIFEREKLQMKEEENE